MCVAAVTLGSFAAVCSFPTPRSARARTPGRAGGAFRARRRVPMASLSSSSGKDAREVPLLFLDIDGVLLPFGEGAPACAADGDPARSFPRHCLAALARLLEARSPP